MPQFLGQYSPKSKYYMMQSGKWKLTAILQVNLDPPSWVLALLQIGDKDLFLLLHTNSTMLINV